MNTNWEQKYKELEAGLCLALNMDASKTPAARALARVPALMAVAEAAAAELEELRKRCTLCPEKDARIAELRGLLAKHAELGDRLLTRVDAAPAPAPHAAALPEIHQLKTGDLIIARGSAEHAQAYFAQYRALIDLAERAREQGIYIEVLVLRPDIPIEKLSEEQMAAAGWQRTPGWLDSQKDMPAERRGPERATLLEIE